MCHLADIIRLSLVGGYFRVDGAAGAQVLFKDERDTHLKNERPLGPTCGFKYPAYAIKYADNMWKLPGGQSSVDFCWSDLAAVDARQGGHR
jgi:hypothetical protein